MSHLVTHKMSLKLIFSFYLKFPLNITMSSIKYSPDIDELRAIAVVSVVIFHIKRL